MSLSSGIYWLGVVLSASCLGCLVVEHSAFRTQGGRLSVGFWICAVLAVVAFSIAEYAALKRASRRPSKQGPAAGSPVERASEAQSVKAITSNTPIPFTASPRAVAA